MKLVSSSCLVFASSLAACAVQATTTVSNPVCGDGVVDGTEQCDHGPSNGQPGDTCSATCTNVQPQPVTHKTTVNWSVRAVNDAVLSCPVGADRATVVSQKLDASGTAVGAPVTDVFACSTGTGTTAGLEPARYRSWIELGDGTNLYAQGLSHVVDLTSADGSYDTRIIDDGGYFTFAWHLVGASTANPLTCGGAGATGAEAISTDVNNSANAASDIFTCSDGAGVTKPLRAGAYTVSIDALDSQNRAIGTAPALTNRAILDRNRVTELGTIDIPITGM